MKMKLKQLRELRFNDCNQELSESMVMGDGSTPLRQWANSLVCNGRDVLELANGDYIVLTKKYTIIKMGENDEK